MILLLLAAACAPELPGAPESTRLTAVEGTVGPWSGTAARVELFAGVAHAEEVKVTGDTAVPLVIVAAKFEWDMKTQTTTFRDDVKVTRGPVTLTADALDVKYKDKDHIDVLTARGHVVVTRGPRVARADNATMTAGDGRVVLTGSPTLAEGVNALAGDRIEVFLDEERATCSGGSQPCRLTIVGGGM